MKLSENMGIVCSDCDGTSMGADKIGAFYYQIAADQIDPECMGKGAIVKVRMSDTADSQVERLWVAIDSIDGEDVIGNLQNYPAVIDAKYDQEIFFKTRHIFKLWIE